MSQHWKAPSSPHTTVNRTFKKLWHSLSSKQKSQLWGFKQHFSCSFCKFMRHKCNGMWKISWPLGQVTVTADCRHCFLISTNMTTVTYVVSCLLRYTSTEGLQLRGHNPPSKRYIKSTYSEQSLKKINTTAQILGTTASGLTAGLPVSCDLTNPSNSAGS